MAGKEIARQRPGYREGRPETYTEEDRRRTVQIASELSIRLTAKVTGISRSTVQRWVHNFLKNDDTLTTKGENLPEQNKNSK